MIKHNLILFFRNIKRAKSIFFINILGLSSGIACVLLITLWITDELNVNKFNKNDAQLFQIMQNIDTEKGIETSENTPGPLSKALLQDMPEVEVATSVIPTVFNTSKGIVSVGDEFYKSTAQYATSDFFNVFSYALLEGDKSKILTDKMGVVISENLAHKLFKTSKNIVGKPIKWSVQDVEINGYVSGVFANIPTNATNQFDLVLNFELFLEYRPWFKKWDVNGPQTYIRLSEQSNIEDFNAKIKGYLAIKNGTSNSSGTLFAQKYSDRYLYGNYSNGKPSEGRMSYIRLFGLIALFILIIACINFMNLSTANASVRMNEIGIKKAIGAERKVLVFQYLLESILMAFLSLIIAALATFSLLKPFSILTGKEVVFNFNVYFVIAIVIITFIVGLIAGSYPALYLSGLNPISILKGKFTSNKKEVLARKTLVVFQFTISIILIVAVFVVYNQIRFVQSANLGYNKDHVVYFKMENLTDGLISEIRNVPGVLNAGGIYNEIVSDSEPITVKDVSWQGKNIENKTNFAILTIGYGFIETLGMQILDGRSFSKEFGSENQIICNETAIQSMGLENPVGKSIIVGNQEREIVGVVKNFHFQSLHENVKPCLLLLSPISELPKVMVKIRAGMEKSTLENLNTLYKRSNPKLSFDYEFLDRAYEALYVSEQRVATLSKYFAGLAIIISCLGLFGLAAFTAEQRKKEIGIRKVLGQSVYQIALLLSHEFAKLIIISNLIALPISYFLVNNWLANFAFKIPLKVWYFIFAGLSAFLIAMFTVGSQTLRAAYKNPLDVLRDE